MWPLRVGPTNTLNGMRDTETSSSGDTGKSKRLFDNTLVMSFVEHTIILTLTGEEESISKYNCLERKKEFDERVRMIQCCLIKIILVAFCRSKKQKFLGLPLINKLFTLVMYSMAKLYRSLLYQSDLSMQNQNNLLSKLIIVSNANIRDFPI